jgi:hypothetical protein
MDNLNQLQKALILGKSAIDDYLSDVTPELFVEDLKCFSSPSKNSEKQFTKLELASLMIAQGLVGEFTNKQNIIAEASVRIAKEVLEEANK